MANDSQLHQEVGATRDAYTAGRDLHVHQAPVSSAPRSGRIWGGVPARNLDFTGRETLLAAVHNALQSGDRAVVQALHGVGGVGKTQLAIEYAHRHANEYDIVWWLNSENPALIGEQFAALAAELVSPTVGAAPLDVMRRAVLAALHERTRWLLVFDNAEKPEDITGWLPGGRGHVLITSRAHTWHEVAVPVDVDVMDRAESVSMLLDRVRDLAEHDAELAAEALGDLPLAVAQAAAFMADTGMPVAEYTGLLRNRATEILHEGRPPTYSAPLAAVIQIGFDRLRSSDPDAAQVASVCAFLAPEPVPAEWFPRADRNLPEPLNVSASNPIAWRKVISRLRGTGLIRMSGDTLLMHRLTQAIIREHLPRQEAEAALATAVQILASNHPGDAEVPAHWPDWARIRPHLLALDPADSYDPGLRDLALDGTWYLIRRGDADAAYNMVRRMNEQWRIKLGEEHLHTLRSANHLARAMHELGDYELAQNLAVDTLNQFRRIAGPDHPDTMESQRNFALTRWALGQTSGAIPDHEIALANCERILGTDHPATLEWRSTLAGVYQALGQVAEARTLHERTLADRERVLGPDHPDTLASRNNVAMAYRTAGWTAGAIHMLLNVIAARRRILGADHPDTLESQRNLALTFRTAGRTAESIHLHEQVLADRERLLGTDHPVTLESRNDLGLAYLAADRASEMVPQYKQTLADCECILGTDHPITKIASRILDEAREHS